MRTVKRIGILFCAIFLFITVSCNNSYSNPDYSKTPVLFVHGSGLSAKTWGNMIEFFSKNGYPQKYLLAIDMMPRNGSNIKAATTYITPAVEKLIRQSNEEAKRNGSNIKHKKIAIISHSMGAVSSRWYIFKEKPEKIIKWISLAGANHGTNAICPYRAPGNDELCPAFAKTKKESHVQIVLNGTPDEPVDETPFGLGKDKNKIKSIPPDKNRQIVYYSIRIEPDRWIKPESSAIIDGAGGENKDMISKFPVRETSAGNFLFKKRVGHDPLPKDEDLIKLVHYLLQKTE